jgi:hypothetical protein
VVKSKWFEVNDLNHLVTDALSRDYRIWGNADCKSIIYKTQEVLRKSLNDLGLGKTRRNIIFKYYLNMSYKALRKP